MKSVPFKVLRSWITVHCLLLLACGFAPTLAHAAPALYSIGQPSDEEQLALEYINRSRANPPAEGARLASTTDAAVLSAYSYFGVNLAAMQTAFNNIAAVPPLAMNTQLLAVARWHSDDMFTKQYQGHSQTNGGIVRDPGQRIAYYGYAFSAWAENVYANAESVFQGHAGFNVDWGFGPDGMQSPPGHRNNIHNASLREVGIGIVIGSNGSVGPQLVTHDFGTKQGATPLLTGVAYYDVNGNNFYDLGEGIGGVTVMVSNASYYAVTANSGGYTVPVAANGNYTVVFSGPGFTTTQQVATVSSLKNVKVDFVPAYSPPVISGPNPAALNQSNSYTFTAVGGATNHQWEQTMVSPFTAVEGAENGTSNVTVNVSAGYSILASDVKASGSYSFHLAHPTPPTSQYVTLNPVIVLRTNSQLTFAKRLGLSKMEQVARAAISTNGGVSWLTLWSQAGYNGNGESGFSRITNSLSAYAGASVQFRFSYEFGGGNYYAQTGSGQGFYFDDVAVSNAELLGTPIASNTTGTSFAFFPTNSNDYLLRIRAQLPSRTLDWGPVLRVAVGTPIPSLQLVSQPIVAGNQVQLDFNVANYRAGMTFQLWKAPDPTGTWTFDNTASISTLIANSKFRASTTNGGAARAFYRIRGSY